MSVERDIRFDLIARLRIKNSPTVTLPRWKSTVKEVTSKTQDAFEVRMMPRDVATRGNSTYDMLKFAFTYCEAIKKLTNDRELGLGD